jgi:2'-5' RNA ligase
MPKSVENLYFIALVPPEPIRTETWQFKEEVADKWGSKKALNSPPHVTLHMPFRLKPKKEPELLSQLTNCLAGAESPKVTLKNFGAFAPRVIYVNVVLTEELRKLQKCVQKCMQRNFGLLSAEYKQQGYSPHLTIAFRDLKKSTFLEAWPEYQNRTYSAEWVANSVALLKHNGSSWDIFKEIPLKK